MWFPDDASSYVALLVGDRSREAAIWWRGGSWWALLPGEGHPTPHATVSAARDALESRLTQLAA
jgi:hypothetical protein